MMQFSDVKGDSGAAPSDTPMRFGHHIPIHGQGWRDKGDSLNFPKNRGLTTCS